MTSGSPPAASGLPPGPVVCNTSPLIALWQIGQLDLLRDLFATVLIPPAVSAEVSPGVPSLPPWVVPAALAQPLPPTVLTAALGPGESEAIALALERSARVLILDDLTARGLARLLGVPIIGTVGVLLAAKRRGLITTVRTCLDELDAFHFHVSPPLREQALRDAGETP